MAQRRRLQEEAEAPGRAGELFLQRVRDAEADSGRFANINRNSDNKDILRDTGMTMEKNQWNQRLLALTSPYEYNRRRKEALLVVEQAVKSSYAAAYTQYIRAGMPEKQSHDKALVIAKQTKEQQMTALRLQFNEKDEQVYTQQTVKSADAFVR